ncbi:MAG: LysR family transcriptional regulator [Myxococcales bacterium]|nr:LysR family transcriptional regulator [Myxococcales bacterium]
MSLSSIDLNLLVVLDAVLTERSVTRAARRIGLSQPATSNALARLRHQLADPLLERRAGSMQPTPYAERLEQPLRDLLARLSSVLAPQRTFDPATARGPVTVAASDYVSRIIVPPLLERMAREAPHLDLVVRAHGQQLPTDDLATGAILLALGFFWGVEAPLVSSTLMNEELACLLPEAHLPLTWDRYLELPHVLVSQSGRVTGHVDSLLRARGVRRRVRAVVPHFLAVPAVLRRVGGVATLPARLAHTAGDGLVTVAPPLAVPGFSVSAVHHSRMAQDGALRWLRDQLQQVCRDL